MDNLRPKIILFGDSLTEQSFTPGGWGASLQNVYTRQADIIVRGFGGYNTRWALALAPTIFPMGVARTSPPVLVTVFFGANDAALLHLPGRHTHVPLEEYEGNLAKIVDHIRVASPSTAIILITPPPVDDKARLEFVREEYGLPSLQESERQNNVTGRYAKMCVKVAGEKRVPVLDLWSLLQEDPQWCSYFTDGLHFNAGGNEVVFQRLMSLIEKCVSEGELSNALLEGNAPLDVPVFWDIVRDNPAASFAKFWKAARSNL